MRLFLRAFLSDMVQPVLGHLYILISAVFSLFLYFFFTAQLSEPYVIAGLMIVLRTLSFDSTGIFLSHITRIRPSTYFIHPILILLLTSACEPPSLVNIDPIYLQDVTVGSSASTIFTVVSVSFVGLDKFVLPLKYNYPCFQAFLRFLTSHSTHHHVLREHNRPGWIRLYVFRNNAHY